MKKLGLVIFLFLTGIFIILFSNGISYSFFKKLLTKNTQFYIKKFFPKKEKIEDIEDLIYIPKKDYKKIFLKKINTFQKIIISIPENILYFYIYNPKTKTYKLLKKYPVSVGRYTRQTPIGEGIIYTKGHIVFKRIYGKNAGEVITKGHDKDGNEFEIPYEKMFGLYMIVNRSDAYVIHSTTEDWKIGQPVSSGCVRMLIPDMLSLYPYVKPPIRVKIEYSLFKLNGEMLTIFPDIYHKYFSIQMALLKFLKQNNINPLIFDTAKIKRALFNPLPITISLNNLLHDFFIEKKLTFDKIRIIYQKNSEEFPIKKFDDILFFFNKKPIFSSAN